MRLLRRIIHRQGGGYSGRQGWGADPYSPPHNPYDYDPRYGNGGGYPGDRAPPPDLTDEAQIIGLGPRDGDTEATHATLNHPWGKVVELSAADSRSSITLVQTEAHPRPFPWAISARFSLDGKTYAPTVPGTWGGDVIFRFVKSFDVKTGPAVETFDLIAGQALPICALIARKLTVSVKIVGESVLNLWVAFVVCPTTQIDCGESSGVVPGAAPNATIARISPDIVSGGQIILPANPLRRGLIIQNHAETNMYVAYGPEARGPGDEGGELWSVLLPPLVTPGELGISQFAGDTYTGPVSAIWDAADGDPPPGEALVTELLAV